MEKRMPLDWDKLKAAYEEQEKNGSRGMDVLYPSYHTSDKDTILVAVRIPKEVVPTLLPILGKNSVEMSMFAVVLPEHKGSSVYPHTFNREMATSIFDNFWYALFDALHEASQTKGD